MGLSDYAKNQVINWLLTSETVTRPTSWWAALHTADPTGTGIVGELSGNGYARVAVTFSPSTAGSSSNAALVTFPEATGPWEQATHASIFTAQSGGQPLVSGELTEPVTVGNTQVYEFKPGTVVMTVT